MASLCLTKPYIDGRVAETAGCASGKATTDGRFNKSKKQGKRRKNTAEAAKRRKQISPTTDLQSKEFDFEQKYSRQTTQTTDSDRSRCVNGTDLDQLSVRLLQAQAQLDNNKGRYNLGEGNVYDRQRKSMLATIRGMAAQRENGRESSKVRKHKRASRLYTQHMPDATSDLYRVHKWRAKSGRNLKLGKFPERTVVQMQRSLQTGKELRNLENFGSGTSNSLFERVQSKYLANTTSIDAMLRDKEERFGALFESQDHVTKDHNKERSKLLPRLRNHVQNCDLLPFIWESEQLKQNRIESGDISNSQNTDYTPDLKLPQTNEGFEPLPPVSLTRRSSDVPTTGQRTLPPIASQRRRQSFPVQRKPILGHHGGAIGHRQYKRRVSLNPAASPMAIPENEILRSSLSAAKKGFTPAHAFSDKLEKKETENSEYNKAGVVGGSPVFRKTHSSMTSHSISTLRSSSKEGKDGDTPTDSEGSMGASKYKRTTRKLKGSRALPRMDTRNSPQGFRYYIKPARMDALMRLWYISAKLAIWLARLYKSHRIVVDDSYNIHSGSEGTGEEVGSVIKKEVLFDVTDYKMKNQLRLSDTTRKILLTPSEKRSEKDLNLVQTALRNIKAISDHSNSVQKQIGKLGYFVGFEGKRVVIRENKPPMNYYLLLAGSAVVIKEDETGNTNPVQFMKRGDIFGEKEILDDTRWQWSIATSGYCEFLLLDREDYRKIFITGGGGGLLSDPDRGGFLRSIELLQQWPINLLGENPNRCLFRYFKRGTVLVNDSNQSDWIFVVKSGSCSVMKQLQMETLTETEVLSRLRKEQKYKPKYSSDPRLVEQAESINQEDHVNLLLEREEEEKTREVSVYQQLEMSSILKELNPDLIGTTLSPRAEAGFDGRRSEFPLSSYKVDITKKTKKHQEAEEPEQDKEDADDKEADHEDGFRMSRHSDRHPPRTPSPTKAAYLRTGISTRSAQRNRNENAEKMSPKCDLPPEIIVTDVHPPEEAKRKLISPQKQVHINEFLFGVQTPDDAREEITSDNRFKEVHLNVRRLTKPDVFGIEPHLYSNQPSLALVSNGAECLMLNKKFYLDNATDECMKFLREEGYPYPSDAEYEEQHWRVMTWKAYQAGVMREILEQK